MQVKLSDIATYKQGKQVEINDQFTEPFEKSCRFIRIIDFTNKNEPPRYVHDYGEQYKVSKNDLVMIRYGSQTAGRVVRGYEGIIANNMFKIAFKEQVNLDFMYYYLSRDEIFHQLRGSQSSSTMPAITFSMMDTIILNIPDIKKQNHIVNIRRNYYA